MTGPGTPTSPASIEVFYSYAHEDEGLVKELQKHLSILKRQGVIREWYDREITAGTEWKGQLDQHLNSAGVILLLVSADFLASDYCYDVEITRALERHDQDEARVIPVLLRKVDGWQGAPFGKLQSLPTDGKPVTSWNDRDEAFADVARGIRRAVGELAVLQPKSSSSPAHPAPFSCLPWIPTPWSLRGAFASFPAATTRGAQRPPGPNPPSTQACSCSATPASLASGAIARAFLSKGRELGLSIVGPVDPLAGRTALVDRILAARVDLVFYSGEEAPYVTGTGGVLGPARKRFQGCPPHRGSGSRGFLPQVRTRLVDGSYLVSAFAPPPQAFAEGYAAQMGTSPGPHVTAGYFAMKAALEAIGQAQTIDPGELRRAAGKLPYFDPEGKAAFRPPAPFMAPDRGHSSSLKS